MELRLAKQNNLIEVLYIIRECSRQLLEKGVKYWNNSHADYNEISKDINSGYVYLLVLNNVPVGTATIKPDKTNQNITTLSRVAIYPSFQKKGYAQEILQFAEKIAKERGSKIIKGTTPTDDKSLEQLLVENGYEKIGVDNEIPEEFVKISFEKKL